MPVLIGNSYKKFNCSESGDHQGSLAQVANLYPDRRAGNSLHTERLVFVSSKFLKRGGVLVSNWGRPLIRPKTEVDGRFEPSKCQC